MQVFLKHYTQTHNIFSSFRNSVFFFFIMLLSSSCKQNKKMIKIKLSDEPMIQRMLWGVVVVEAVMFGLEKLLRAEGGTVSRGLAHCGSLFVEVQSFDGVLSRCRGLCATSRDCYRCEFQIGGSLKTCTRWWWLGDDKGKSGGRMLGFGKLHLILIRFHFRLLLWILS